MFGSGSEDFILGMGADVGSFSGDMGKANNSVDEFGNRVDNAGKKGDSFIGKLTGMINPATLAAGAIIGIGAAAISAWSDFDAGSDAILAKTGATGQALDDMSQSVLTLKSGTAGLNTSMETIGQVIGEVNVRTGLTGAAMEDFSGKIVNMTKITGGDAVTAVADVTRVMGAWNVPMDKGSGLLDKLFTATQTYGVSVEDLTGKLTQFGPSLQEMGFSIDESIAMLGGFEKAGVNTDVVLAGLKKSVVNFAKENIPLAQGLDDVTKKILGASSQTEALNIAAGVFGSKAAPDMVAAIQSGNFEFGEAAKAIEAAGGSIDDVTTRSMDFGDRWQLLWNNVTVALVPVGQFIMDLADAALPMLQGAMDGVGAAFQAALPYIQPFVDAISGFWTTIASGGDIGTAFGDMFSGIGAAIANAWPVVSEALGGILGSIVQFFIDNGPTILGTLATWGLALAQWVWDSLPGLLGALGSLVASIWTWIVDNAPAILAQLATWATAFWTWIVEVTPTVLAALGTFVSGVWDWIVAEGPGILLKLGEWALAFIGWIVPMIPPFLLELGKIALSIIGWIGQMALDLAGKIVTEWIPGLWNWITGPGGVLEVLPPKLLEIAGAIWTWLTTTAGDLWTKLINEWVPGLWNWITGEGGVIATIGPELLKIAEALWTWVTTTAGDLWTKLINEWVPKLWEWITGEGGVLSSIGTKLGEIWTAITGWITGTAEKIGGEVSKIGANMASGIGAGFKTMWDNDVMGGILGALSPGGTLAVKMQQQIEAKSPSQLYARIIGEPIAAGIGLGFTTRWAGVTTDMVAALTQTGPVLQAAVQLLCDADGPILAPIKTLCDTDLPASMKVVSDTIVNGLRQTLTDADAWVLNAQAGLSYIGGEIVGGVKAGLEAAYGGALSSWMSFFDALWGEASKRSQEIRDLMNFGTAGSGTPTDHPGNPASGGTGSGGVIPMAMGGIVTRPMLALVGEGGPEAIVPLSRFRDLPSPDSVGSGGGGGMNIQPILQQKITLVINGHEYEIEARSNDLQTHAELTLPRETFA